MGLKGWLPIAEYSGKYRVSISTLRRKIKAGDIEYSFSEGKYLLKDAPLAQQSSPSIEVSAKSQAPTVAPPQKASGSVVEPLNPQMVVSDDETSPVLATANRLLNELKKAYSVILQEKEEQILQLKEEVSDLKTLVRVLEAENERLNKQRSDTSWLND